MDEYEILAETSYKQIESIMAKAVKKGSSVYSASDKVDRIVSNRYLDFPIFLAAMYLLFWLTINISSVFVDFFDYIFGAVFVDGVRMALEKISAPEAVITVLADGVGVGIQTLSTLVPVIFILFFFIGLLESSGYMSRAAFTMDGIMRYIGLPGKAFIPLLIGFGCAVPAFLATRSLENRRDRILSIFMIPFMSCGARLPVYVLFAAAFFPDSGTNIVFLLYLSGIVLAMLTGLLLKGTIYKGTVTPFIMELPQYHVPSLKGAVLNALFRIRAFIKKGVRVLVPIIALLGILNSVGVLETAGRAVSPVFEPIGIDRENWPASVSLFSGLFAKEVIICSLTSLYSQHDESAENDEESLFKNMRNAFHDSDAAVFCFLLFVLLYVPCFSAISVSIKEIGVVPVVLQAAYSTVLGWCLATIIYQCFEGGSMFYIGLASGILVAFVSIVIGYAKYSGRLGE